MWWGNGKLVEFDVHFIDWLISGDFLRKYKKSCFFLFFWAAGYALLVKHAATTQGRFVLYSSAPEFVLEPLYKD